MKKGEKKGTLLTLLNDKKASQSSDIPFKIIKENQDLIGYFIFPEYPASLTIFQKDDKTDKNNYRPICIFPNLSKIYEQFMENQIYPYLRQTFSKY